MKTKILQIIKDKPKNYSRMIKASADMHKWVLKHSNVQSDVYAEMIYSAVYDINNICKNGNNKKFKNFAEGYGYCGHSSKCRCAKKSVSSKVSKSKQEYTDDKKQEINLKRVKTSLSKYGVTNNGQTKKALKGHKNFYNNISKVKSAILKNKQTKHQRYGDENYNNIGKIKETYSKNHPITYWEERFPEKNMKVLMNKELLSEMFVKYPNISELATYLNVHEQTVYRHLYMHGLRKKFKSLEEQELVTFLKDLGIDNIVCNSRKIISVDKYVNGEYIKQPRELDIYLPDYNIAIEYCGVYWHHDRVEHITKDYHYLKYKACKDKGIQLITIFSTFWYSNKKIVKEILKNKLKLSDKLSIYARKCEVRTNVPEHKEFLNNHHIQGYTTSQHQIGLYYNNKLEALMTFGKSRVGIGKHEEDSYELVRYASDKRVVGGASKLLKYFIQTNIIKKIISYSDNEWSDGNLYNVLGFTLDTEIKPSYWYIKGKENKMYHRYNYAKHKLVKMGFDSTKTEKEITYEMGLLRIWDCGKKRWVYNAK